MVPMLQIVAPTAIRRMRRVRSASLPSGSPASADDGESRALQQAHLRVADRASRMGSTRALRTTRSVRRDESREENMTTIHQRRAGGGQPVEPASAVTRSSGSTPDLCCDAEIVAAEDAQDVAVGITGCQHTLDQRGQLLGLHERRHLVVVA